MCGRRPPAPAKRQQRRRAVARPRVFRPLLLAPRSQVCCFTVSSSQARWLAVADALRPVWPCSVGRAAGVGAPRSGVRRSRAKEERAAAVLVVQCRREQGRGGQERQRRGGHVAPWAGVLGMQRWRQAVGSRQPAGGGMWAACSGTGAQPVASLAPPVDKDEQRAGGHHGSKDHIVLSGVGGWVGGWQVCGVSGAWGATSDQGRGMPTPAAHRARQPTQRWQVPGRAPLQCAHPVLAPPHGVEQRVDHRELGSQRAQLAAHTLKQRALLAQAAADRLQGSRREGRCWSGAARAAARAAA